MWEGIDCIIGKLFSVESEKDLCRTYIEDLVKSNPSGILDDVEVIVKTYEPNLDFSGIKGYDASLCPGMCTYTELHRRRINRDTDNSEINSLSV